MFIDNKLNVQADDLTVKSEPMFFQASYDLARRNGGPLTHTLLDAITPALAEKCFIDSRVHMLMPGWWPCIPGWHHDDVERSRSDGQPNYRSPSYRANFAMAVVGSADSRTEFAVGDFKFTPPKIGRVIYRDMDPIIEQACTDGVLSRLQVPKDTLVWFTDRDWHRGVQSTNNGWRWFARLTWRTKELPIANEMRLNANVYMQVPEEGW